MSLLDLQRSGCLSLAVFLLSLVILRSEMTTLRGGKNSPLSVPYQAIRVSLKDGRVPQEITRSSSNNQFKAVSSSMTWTQMVRETKDLLGEFRYPANLKVPSLRVPDYYFTSHVAQQIRKRRGRLNHLSRVYTNLFVERKAIHISILGDQTPLVQAWGNP